MPGDDSAVLKEVADYFAASQQIQEAIPLYLRVLELQPDDSNAREKLATGFVLTNQRAQSDRDAAGDHQADIRKNISPTICSRSFSMTRAARLHGRTSSSQPRRNSRKPPRIMSKVC